MYALLPSAPEPGSGLSPDKRRKKRWALAALALAGLALAATVSQWATVKIYSNPPGVLDSTSYVPTGTVTNIATPPLSANGSRFTHWTVNGVRQVDAIGISQSALALTITESIDVVAQYTPETQDLDSDQVPDWYEIQQYGNLLTGANDDTDGDGVSLYDEYVKGSQPRIHDSAAGGGIVEGGVSRRRSATVQIRDAANPYFFSYTESSSPPGAITRQEWVPPGTSLTTTAPSLEQWGYKFGQWKLNGVRQESTSGIALTQATFNIAQDSTAVAEYLPTTQDSDGDSIPDWYEIQQYGNLLTGTADDTDGDGVGFYDEYVANTQPRIPDYASSGGALEGGISRRRSATIQITTSPTYYTYTERSEPPGVVTVQSSHPAGTSITTSNQNGEVWGYRFTHWTINGVRQQAAAGFAVSQATFTLNENTVAVANFVPTTQDLDSDQIPDWYEIQQYGAITNGPDSDTDGDGVSFYDEYVKGTQPLIHDSAAAGGIVEGGTSRRRGASTVVDLSLLLEDFSLATNTTQESNTPVKVGELTSTSSAIGIVVTANPGFEVRLVNGKYEIWTTVPTDFETTPLLSIQLAVTNARGTTINLSGTAALTDNRLEDADGDGLTEAQEEDTYGTSDVIADFDGDNYRDGAEVTAGTSPTDPHSFPWEGEIPLPQIWARVSTAIVKDLGFRGDRFVSVEQSSVDGSTWATNSYGTNSALLGFAGYGDGLWWATGTNGLLRAGANTNGTVLSWESRTSPETNDLARLAYGERTYFMRGPLGTGYGVRSTNGMSWSNVGTSGSVSNSRSMVFVGGRFLMAAGTEIRSIPSGAASTWTTNLITNLPNGFLLTNLLARNGSVFAGSSLAADTNGRRTMVVGQSTNGTNWSFQTSSLTLPTGVELAEVAHGYYFAVPTVTNGNAWFLVSSNASNWLKAGGSWTNGRVARGISAGAGQLVVATDEGLYAGRFNRTGKDFTTTHENFTAALGTNWSIRKPFADSDVQVSGGNLRLLNRGTLILEREFDGAFEVSGRLRFAGSEYDSLRIVYASDKTSTSPSREMDKGVGLSLSSRGGDWPPFGPKITIGALNYPAEGTLLGSANPTVAMNTWTDFRITDDGRTIRVFWDDLVNPIITTNYTGSRRGYFAIYNREGSGGGSSISAGSVVEVERLTLRGAEVIKQAQTISFPAISQKTYGDVPFSLGAAATSGLPLTYASENTAVAIVATNGIATITGVGTSRITVSQGGNADYYAATPVQQTLTVVARPITIRANDVTRGYGETNPPLTSQVSVGSLVAGHTYTASLSTTANGASLGANSPYPITVSNVVVRDAGGSDVTANYQVTTTNGNLYVPSLPQTITFPVITGKTYGDPVFLLGATASSGLPLAYSVADPSVAVVATNGAVTILRSGSTTITASQAGSSLYDPATPVSRSLTVSARPLTLRADDKSRMFGQANPLLTYSVAAGSLVSGHVVAVSLSTAATTNSPASATPYPISVDSAVIRDSLSQDVSAHYLLNLVSGGLTITGQGPQITSTNSFSGTVGVVFSNTVTASGTGPITFGGTNLPGGLSIATNGLISGVPTTAGTNTATLTASNSIGTTNQNVTFVIARGTPVISNWPSAPAISYGQAVSNSVLSGGSASVPGAFSWALPTNRPNVGTNVQSVTFTPVATNNYVSVSTNVNLVVTPAAAVLTWAPSPATGLTYPAPLSASQLNATSTVAGTFDYNPTNGSVLNAGTNTLVATFRPADTNSYFDGVTVTNTVVVAKGSNVITFGSLAPRQLGEAGFSLTATASSGLTVSYASANTNVATVSGSTVSIVGAGTTAIVASQGGNGNWNSANPVTNNLTVLPKTLLTVTGALVVGKVYDGSRGAGVDWGVAVVAGVASNHVVGLVTSNAVAQFADAKAGTNKTVSVTGLGLSGADAGRYELGSVLLLSGTIEPKGLGVSGLGVVKRGYEGGAQVRAPLDWSGHVLAGKVGVDEVYVQTPYVEGKYDDGLVGTNKAVTWWNSEPVLGGAAAGNYYLDFPEGVLFGEVEKGLVVPQVSGTQQVYNGQGQGVTAVASVGGSNLAVVTRYWGLSNTVYATNTAAPTNAGVYGVEVRVNASEQNYAGTTNVVLTIQKKGLVLAAGSDTIRAGAPFRSNNYTASGLVGSDAVTGALVTHLRSVTNTNPLVGYQPTNNQSGVYRILRGSVGDNVSHNYAIDYREGTLTVLKDSVLTEGTVMPLGAGQGFTLLVMSNRGVTNWGVTDLGVVPNALRAGTTNFVGATGVGAGSGSQFGMAWTRDGQPVVWGATNPAVTGMPGGLDGIVGMSGGVNHVVYHREAGSNRVAGAWGTNDRSQTAVPTNGNTGVVAVAAGANFGLRLKTNGAVEAWGDGTGGATTVPAGLSNAVGVAAGTYHGVALRADGTVTSWGFPASATNVPEELTNRSATNFVRAVAVTVGGAGTLVLRADGSLRAWGNPASEPWRTNGLPGLNASNPVVAVSASLTHAAGLRRDGTVVVWGTNSGALTNVGSLVGLVPMGGPDSDGDGWANEAELRVGTDPLSTNSTPVKASLGVTFGYGSSGSSFSTSASLNEGSNRTVGTLQVLDTMGRLETGNQADMTVELSEEGLKTFEAVSRTNRVLRFRTNPVFDGVTSNNVYRVDVIVRDTTNSAAITTTLNVAVGNVAPQIIGTTNFPVDENVPLGTVVGTLQASEGNVTWSLTQSNSLFAIEAQSGRILTRAPIDYEALTNKTVILQVRVTDAGGLSGSANVTVPVNDLPEDTVPPVLTLVGITPMRVGQNQLFSDPGATVTDNIDATRTVSASSGTVNTAVLGTYVLTYTASDAAGNPAVPRTRQVMVDGWTTIPAPGQPVDGQVLTQYAVGGASSPAEASAAPVTAVQTNGSGQPVLTLTALVRVNDAALGVQAEAVTSLADFGATGLTTTVNGTPADDQTGVPQGFQRQVFTVPANNTRQFIRLKVTR